MNVNISEFRANLLKYLKKAKSGEEITICSNGELLATISPPIDQSTSAREKLKVLAATAILSDVLSPIDESWDASK